MTEPGLTGAVVLVTGAGGRTGAAIALGLVRVGAAVSLVGRRRQRLDQLADGIGVTGGDALVVEADITARGPAGRAVQATVDRFGRLDVVVNNAGVMLLGTALHATLEDWDRMIAVNLEALLYVTHAAVPHLIDAAATSPRGVADIVNVSSTAGRVARPGSSVYTMTRWGLNGFTEALRQELTPERVRVSVVEPAAGAELADHLGEISRGAPSELIRAIEPMRPDDVADAVTYILTRDRSVAVNEMVLRADTQTW
jgi:NADP-dependent 3-hydroxy acid dehydrogenase YdfG